MNGRQLLPDEPAFGVNWFEAVNYCRWLTEAAGWEEDAQNYQRLEFPEGDADEPGWLNLSANTQWPMRLDRPGFRLLTGAEWEYVARAGTETVFSFGDSESLLQEYGWYNANANQWSQRTGLLRPSIGGLFDMHGNLWEWTNDPYEIGSFLRLLRGGSWGDVAASLISDRKTTLVVVDLSNGALI